ncbi:hypothetical protein [Noviherbaspirillum pedocola]|uniref:Uncharacterized protein n=1 Tax=Noviherbaspirillum pedocola TaxID=2801341 RepID=A0A934SXI9_9BURK|nr:hypothetical protein [Noviherbaspirillum pedocola]MBK4737343.1 hypothetical protein [Noviherbaspirillum pedocola]
MLSTFNVHFFGLSTAAQMPALVSLAKRGSLAHSHTLLNEEWLLALASRFIQQ